MADADTGACQPSSMAEKPCACALVAFTTGKAPRAYWSRPTTCTCVGPPQPSNPAEPYIAKGFTDTPGLDAWAGNYVLASRAGGRLGVIDPRPRWTIECDRGCEPFRAHQLAQAETALRDHWRDVHGWDER